MCWCGCGSTFALLYCLCAALFLIIVPAMCNSTVVTHSLSSLHLQTITVEQVCTLVFIHTHTQTHKKSYLFSTTHTNGVREMQINSCDLLPFSISAHTTSARLQQAHSHPSCSHSIFQRLLEGALLGTAWHSSG